MAEQVSEQASAEHSSDNDFEPWQLAMIDLFVHAVQAFGLPRSIGQIYGMLYCSSEPVTMQAITDQLKISKASASQGLKALRQFGAVKTVYIIGERREHYEPEMSLRRLIHGIISEVVEPHLASGKNRLEALSALVDAAEEPQRAIASERYQTLKTWHGKANKLLPVLRNFL